MLEEIYGVISWSHFQTLKKYLKNKSINGTIIVPVPENKVYWVGDTDMKLKQ